MPVRQKPQVIFDAATLTGAIIGALGNIFTGFFTKNEKLVEKNQTSQSKNRRKSLADTSSTEEHTVQT